MQEITERGDYSETLSVGDFIGAKVITGNGKVIGRVAEIRWDVNEKTIEGILVKRGLFTEPFYIGIDYVKTLSHNSFILGIEPSVLLLGTRVITNDGEVVGYVKEVVRVKNTNNINYLVIKQRFRDAFSIKPSHIAHYGKSIMLKEGVDVPKKSFWKH